MNELQQTKLAAAARYERDELDRAKDSVVGVRLKLTKLKAILDYTEAALEAAEEAVTSAAERADTAMRKAADAGCTDLRPGAVTTANAETASMTSKEP